MELLTVGSGLSYQPGDLLGVWIEQVDPLVEEILIVSSWTAIRGRRVQRRDDAALPLAEGAAGADRPYLSVSCSPRRPLPGGACFAQASSTRAP